MEFIVGRSFLLFLFVHSVPPSQFEIVLVDILSVLHSGL